MRWTRLIVRRLLCQGRDIANGRRQDCLRYSGGRYRDLKTGPGSGAQDTVDDHFIGGFS